MRASSSRACRAATTRWARCSASARTRAGGARWSRDRGARPRDRVLDVATGTGMVAGELVRRYGCSVVGLDQSEQMLAARAREARRAIPSCAERVELVAGEAERLPFADGEFDALTFTYLLRYVDDPARDAARARARRQAGRADRLARVRRPGRRAAARALDASYTRVGLPALGRLVSRDWYEVGRFLGPSIAGFYERYPLARAAASCGARPGIGAVEMRRDELRRRAWSCRE